MFGPEGGMSVAVGVDGFQIQILDLKIIKNFHIRSFFCLIPEHCPDLTASTAIVALPLPAELETVILILKVNCDKVINN